jgi:hypothetical protein
VFVDKDKDKSVCVHAVCSAAERTDSSSRKFVSIEHLVTYTAHAINIGSVESNSPMHCFACDEKILQCISFVTTLLKLLF